MILHTGLSKNGNLLTFITERSRVIADLRCAGIRDQTCSVSWLCSPSYWLYSQVTWGQDSCQELYCVSSETQVQWQKESLVSRWSLRSVLRFMLVDLALNQLIIVTSRMPRVPVDGGLWRPNQTIWVDCGGETNTSKPKWTCYKDARNAINKYPFHPKQPSWKCSERIRWKEMSG